LGTETPGGDAGTPREDPLVFMSDASAEAERLMSALRNRGYVVVDVPLTLLVGRVSVQRPALILCDVDAPGALEQVKRLRDVPGGGQVDIVFFGQPSRTLDELRDEVFHESSGFFVRPVDTFGLLRKVEALVGPPSTPDRRMGIPSSRPPAALPRSAPDSARPVPPPVSAMPDAAAMLALARDARVLDDEPASTRSTPANALPVLGKPSPIPSSGPSSLPPSSAPGARSSSIPSIEPSLPQPIPLGFGAEPEGGPSHLGRHIPQSEISPELEGILARAEQRVGSSEGSVRSPASIRLTPEAEVDAVLPQDVLSALDEPLEIDDADDDDEGGTGTGGSAGGGSARTGLLTGVGSGALTQGGGSGGPTVGGFGSSPSELYGAAGPTAPPPRRDAVKLADLAQVFQSAGEEAPRTPPASGSRPPSWPAPLSVAGPMTSVEPKPLSAPAEREPHAAVLRATPLPPAPDAMRSARGSTAVVAQPEPPFEVPRRDAPLEIPLALARGDSARGIARAIRSRFSGALAFEHDAGIRRVVLRDGDFVTAASGIASESLVAFLTARGTLSPDVQKALGHKLPAFGRHAGAALIAHGHLRQDELWPVLRSHAEWLVGRVLEMTAGGASIERDVPARLEAEPAVFGGATGAEVYVEIVRRVVPPEEALVRLGGQRARVIDGPNPALLGECALSDAETARVARSKAATLGEVLDGTPADLASVVYALVELGVLEALSPAAQPSPAEPAVVRRYDVLDEQALRSRILARKALVMEGDYFAVLGVPKSATSYDVERAYSELRNEFEPSRILTAGTATLRPDVDLILEVLDEAYEILSDQLRRERYRRALEATPN